MSRFKGSNKPNHPDHTKTGFINLFSNNQEYHDATSFPNLSSSCAMNSAAFTISVLP